MTSQSTSSSSSLEHKSELRAPTAQQAAHYLDAAIAARTVPGLSLVQFNWFIGNNVDDNVRVRVTVGSVSYNIVEVYDEARRSHFIFALNVYQYRVEKNGGGSEGCIPQMI